MHFNFHTALLTSALIGAALLAMRPPGGRIIPAVALVAAALAALIDYRIIQLSVSKFRIDVIVPAILVVTGGIMWSRSSAKTPTTAATVVTLAGVILLLTALRTLR